jgi:hypothetical protein
MQYCTTEDRFWRKVARTGPAECWLWLAGRNPKGYGRFGMHGSAVFAHRQAYALTVGAIPEGMYVCHRCDNPPCCNPEHLFLGTHADNIRDMTRKGRADRDKKRGDLNGSRKHPASRPRGPQHPRWKQAPELCSSMRSMLAAGIPYLAICQIYGVSLPFVRTVRDSAKGPQL